MATYTSSTFEGSSLLPDSARIDELRHILRSNAVPPEMSRFRRVAEEAPIELARYDAEIESLRESMDKITSERATLAWYSDGCRSVAAPVRRLPNELLAEIFDMCAPEGQEVVSATTPNQEVERVTKRYLLQFAEVCSHWHSVALGTPNLWSLIVLNTVMWRDSGQSFKTLLNVLTSSLQRGGECALTLQVAVRHRDDEHSILRLLSEHSRRWSRVSLWIDPQSFPHLSRAKGALDRLGFLQLVSRTPRGEIHTASNIFQIAPRLSEVWLAAWRAPLPILPWNQLSFASLGLYAGWAPESMQILRLLPKSATLSIRTSTLSTPQPPILSNIGKLTVELVTAARSRPILGVLFQSLTLPRLGVFCLVRSGFFPRWEQGPFLDFASRSSLQTTLTSLRIDVVIITTHELLECLAALPSLEELFIADCDDDSDPALLSDHLLHMLTDGSDDTCLVPSLSFLQFTSRFTFDNNLFWDFIASRVRHRPFEHDFRVVAYWCGSREHGFSAEFEERLEELQDKGGFMFKTGPNPDLFA